MNALSEHLELFKLDWLNDPAAALAQGRERGISDPHFVEMSAWCAELHAQLAELAEERSLPLLLMGGNATALRLEAAKQRGIERRIKEPAGPNLKVYRAALAQVTGIAAKRLGQFPRVPMWEYLAQVEDVDAALAAIDDAL